MSQTVPTISAQGSPRPTARGQDLLASPPSSSFLGKSPTAVPLAESKTVPDRAVPSKAAKPWYKRLFGWAHEQANSETEPEPQAESSGSTQPTAGGAPTGGDANSREVIGRNAASLTPEPAAWRMPDLLNDMVGGVPIGALLSSGTLFVAGLTGEGSLTASRGSSDARAPVLRQAVTSSDGKKIILSYDEALSASVPSASSFVVKVDGVAVTLSSLALGSDGQTIELTLAQAIAGLQNVQVSYTQPAPFIINGVDQSSSIKDAAGNRAVGLTDQAVTVVDGTSPGWVSSKLYTSGDTSVVVLSYNEALSSAAVPLANAFTVKNSDNTDNLVSAVSVVGKEVRLTLQNKLTTGIGGVYVSYTAPTTDAGKTNAAIQDVSGNDAGSLPSGFVSNTADSAAPTFSAASINAAGTQVTITMSEALDAMKTAAAGAYAVQITEGATTRSVGVSAASVSGDKVTLTLNERVQTATAGIQVSYFDPVPGGNDAAALQDLAGNDVASFLSNAVVNAVDTTAPVVTQTSLKDSKTLVLAFAEDLAATTAAAQAFSVQVGGSANAVTAVKVNGKTLELTLTNAVAVGNAVTWSYAAPAASIETTNAAVQDRVGNDMAAVSNQTLDTTRPSLTSAVTSSNGNVITMTFNEPLLNTNLPAASLFEVRGSNSTAARTVSSLSVSGNVLTLNLTPSLLSSEAISLIYKAPTDTIGTANTALQDVSGNDFLPTGTSPVVVLNKVSPLLVAKSLGMNSAGSFDKVVLTFDDGLQTPAPASSAFTVRLGNTQQSISAAEISGKTVTLTLTTPLAPTAITSAAALSVSYTAPGTNPLKDSDGNAVPAFANQTVALLGTTADETLTGTPGAESFHGRQGNDTLVGAGGVDTFVWSDTTTAGQKTTLRDFGLKQATGALQGSAEADVLDLRSLLVGYTSGSASQFIQFTTDANAKLVMNIDKDGSSSSSPFSASSSVVFDNIRLVSGTATGALEVSSTIGGTAYSPTSYTTGNLLTRLIDDQQLILPSV